LDTLSVMPELWNHYAAAVFRSKLPLKTVPIPRGHRTSGTTQMNFVALVYHGLSAISVFGDIVGVRLLLGSLVGALLAGLAIFAIIAVRFMTDWAIPGWATYSVGLLAIFFSSSLWLPPASLLLCFPIAPIIASCHFVTMPCLSRRP